MSRLAETSQVETGAANAGAEVRALRVPPHSLEAEQAVLGGLLLDGSAWDRVAESLLATDFYLAEHRILFDIVVKQAEVGAPIDLVTVAQSLASHDQLEQVGGVDFLASLCNGSRGTANIAAYADIIRERAILRRLIGTTADIAESAYLPKGRSAEDVLDEAERAILGIADTHAKGDGPQHVDPLLSQTVTKIEELLDKDSPITGLPSGFKDLDDMTAGWQDSDLIIVAARPSMGKTAFALNCVEHAILNQDDPVVVFSLEMPATNIILRLLSSIGRIDQHHLRTGKLDDAEWDGFNRAVTKLKGVPLYIDDDTGITPMDMRARLRRLGNATQRKMAMIVVDYLQLMRLPGMGENRVNEISAISSNLKQMAREFECPVIALSQLNRSVDSRHNKEPILSDLRDSGAIEQDADVILFLYREEYYSRENSNHKGEAEVIIGKQRNGPTGKVPMAFDRRFARFANRALPQHEEQYASYSHDAKGARAGLDD